MLPFYKNGQEWTPIESPLGKTQSGLWKLNHTLGTELL